MHIMKEDVIWRHHLTTPQQRLQIFIKYSKCFRGAIVDISTFKSEFRNSYFLWQFHSNNCSYSLTLSWRRPLSHRNQSIDLQSKSMDWFLYDNGLRHERVKYSKYICKGDFRNSAVISGYCSFCEQLLLRGSIWNIKFL